MKQMTGMKGWTKPGGPRARRARVLALIMAFGICPPIRAYQAIEPADDDTIRFFITSTQAEKGALVCTRSREDLSFRVQVGAHPAVDSPPGSQFEVPLQTPFRVFNQQSKLEFLPKKTSGTTEALWLVEEENRRGDIQVGQFQVVLREGMRAPSAPTTLLLPVQLQNWRQLVDLEKEYSFGAGILPRAL